MFIHLLKVVNVGINLPKKKRVKHGKGKVMCKHINPLLTSHYSLKSIHKELTFDGLQITAKKPLLKEVIEYRKDSFTHSNFGLYSNDKQTFVFSDEIGMYYLNNTSKGSKNEKFVRVYFTPKEREITSRLLEHNQKRQISPTIPLKKSCSFDYLGKTKVKEKEVKHKSVNYILSKAAILAMGKNIAKVGTFEDGKKIQGRFKLDVDLYISAGNGKEVIHPSIDTPAKKVLIKLPIVYVNINKVIFDENSRVVRVLFDESTIKTYKFLENLEDLLDMGL